jgi:hypothetical protein
MLCCGDRNGSIRDRCLKRTHNTFCGSKLSEMRCARWSKVEMPSRLSAARLSKCATGNFRPCAQVVHGIICPCKNERTSCGRHAYIPVDIPTAGTASTALSADSALTAYLAYAIISVAVCSVSSSSVMSSLAPPAPAAPARPGPGGRVRPATDGRAGPFRFRKERANFMCSTHVIFLLKLQCFGLSLELCRDCAPAAAAMIITLTHVELCTCVQSIFFIMQLNGMTKIPRIVH